MFEEVDAAAGTYKMKSLHTQSYLSGLSGSQWALGETGKEVTLVKSTSVNGAIVFKIEGNGDNGFHAHGANNTVISYANTAGANHYFFEEIEISDDVANIKYTVSLGANESGSDTKAYSTLYLAYNAQIPEGVTASIVTGINEIGQLVMEEVTGGILPANTAVVLSCENAGSADFKYTADEATAIQGNILSGTVCNKLVECGNTYNVYMLGRKSGRVAFYWTYENRDASGVKVADANGSYNHNDGGYVLCNANKAYLLESESNGQAAAEMYSLPIGGGTTGVDEAKGENGEVKAVYDLQGRKLVKVTSPGIYVVNGKKVYVTEVEE